MFFFVFIPCDKSLFKYDSIKLWNRLLIQVLNIDNYVFFKKMCNKYQVIYGCF